MEKYDTIIVGAGIAGCSLAHNLKNIDYSGKILVIDKNQPGNKKGYGSRTCFQQLIKEYNLPHEYIFKGMKLGMYFTPKFKIKIPIYSLNYEKTCKHLLKKSHASYSNECATEIKNNLLKTNEKIYSFKYLIDCSGTNFFLRKKLNKPFPFRYWTGCVKTISNNHGLEKGYIYNLWQDNGDFEEIYAQDTKTLHGDWKFNPTIDFDILNKEKNSYLNSIKHKIKIIKQEKIGYPVTQVFPLAHKNYAFLGDSFGNAPSASGFGFEAAIKASEILANSIKKNNLKEYEKIWIKKNFIYNFKYLLSRIDRYTNYEFIKKIKNYPGMGEILTVLEKNPNIWLDLLLNQGNPAASKSINSLFPKRRYLFLLLHFIYLSSKYLAMKIDI